MSTEPGPQPLGSNTLLSKPLGRVLLGNLRSVYGHALLVLASPSLKLYRNKDNLRISKVTHASMAHRAECRIQMAEVLGSMVIGLINILLLDFFCFHIVKPRMPTLPLLPNLCVCEKRNCFMKGTIIPSL